MCSLQSPAYFGGSIITLVYLALLKWINLVCILMIVFSFCLQGLKNECTEMVLTAPKHIKTSVNYPDKIWNVNDTFSLNFIFALV